MCVKILPVGLSLFAFGGFRVTVTILKEYDIVRLPKSKKICLHIPVKIAGFFLCKKTKTKINHVSSFSMFILFVIQL